LLVFFLDYKSERNEVLPLLHLRNEKQMAAQKAREANGTAKSKGSKWHRQKQGLSEAKE
jgi:hypothetical protein